MNICKDKRPKFNRKWHPHPIEVPVNESKVWFTRSNVNDLYAVIWLKSWIISYPECFKFLFRLGGASGAKIKLQLWSDFLFWGTVAIAEELFSISSALTCYSWQTCASRNLFSPLITCSSGSVARWRGARNGRNFGKNNKSAHTYGSHNRRCWCSKRRL